MNFLYTLPHMTKAQAFKELETMPCGTKPKPKGKKPKK